MAFTIRTYNHTFRLLMAKAITYTALKLELLNNSASFVATNTQRSQVNNSGAYKVEGNGWTAGGVLLPNVVVSTVDTDGVMIDADDLVVAASGGSIGPAYKAVIYDDTHADDAPLFFIDFGGSQEAGAGTDFKVTWDAFGIFRGTIAAS